MNKLAINSIGIDWGLMHVHVYIHVHHTSPHILKSSLCPETSVDGTALRVGSSSTGRATGTGGDR